jgi:hypothetical protein
MNAKEEFVKLVKYAMCKPACAEITVDIYPAWGDTFYSEEKKKYTGPTTCDLLVGYTNEEYEEFLGKLDFEYDDGYGTQQLYGYVWFENETWAERDEYDGSEWWVLNKIREVPERLMR